MKTELEINIQELEAMLPMPPNYAVSAPPENITAADILKQAASIMRQRAKDYDSPGGARSVPATVAAFNAITGQTLTPLQGWIFLAILKLVRGHQSPGKLDNWIDLSAYGALAGEEALKSALTK